MNTVVGIIIALVMFLAMVAVHEGGHFLAAKAVGVKVNEFSLGMGPLIFSKKRGETEYSLRALPIGGYVSMEGEDKDSDDERAFNKKPWWAKLLVLFAGPFMNFALAVLILICIIMVIGTSSSNTVYSVAEGTAAEEAGLKAGLVITAVNGTPVSGGAEVNAALSGIFGGESGGAQNAEGVVFTCKDPSSGVEDDYVLKLSPDESNRIKIGITFEVNRDILSAVRLGAVNSVVMEGRILDALVSLFTGNVSIDEFVGPVGIVSIVNETAQTGTLNVFYLMALLSLNLGLVNILPLPALDGGRMLFVVIRAVTGRVITDEMESRIHFAGIIVLFSLMIFITVKDINSIVGL